MALNTAQMVTGYTSKLVLDFDLLLDVFSINFLSKVKCSNIMVSCLFYSNSIITTILLLVTLNFKIDKFIYFF